MEHAKSIGLEGLLYRLFNGFRGTKYVYKFLNDTIAQNVQ